MEKAGCLTELSWAKIGACWSVLTSRTIVTPEPCACPPGLPHRKGGQLVEISHM